MNKNNAIQRIPVIVISGFLGSGKTTLLNHLLRHAAKSALIINEFGSTPIDQQLLKEHKLPMSVLAGGCLCCQIKGALTPILKNLRMAWDTKTEKPFDRVIIETSGIANPEPVMDILLRERWISTRFQLQTVAITVSAVTGAESLECFGEARAQLGWADIVLVTHGDLATSEQLAFTSAWFDKLAPGTIRLNVVQGVVEADLILGAAKKIRPIVQQQNLAEHDFNSISLQLDMPVTWPHLLKVLQSLLKNHRELLRIKGVVFTPDNPEPLLIQGVGNTLYPPARLPARTADDGKSRLVFISTGDARSIEKDFHALLASQLTAFQ